MLTKPPAGGFSFAELTVSLRATFYRYTNHLARYNVTK
jgi:hypothetical protein